MFDRSQPQERMAVKQITGTLALLAICSMGAMSDAGLAPASSSLSRAQKELVEFGLGRFADQGLGLSEINIDFRPSSLDCQGHTGLYMYRTQTLRMCSLDKKTMLHELAHAWARHNLTPRRVASKEALIGIVRRRLPWKQVAQTINDPR